MGFESKVIETTTKVNGEDTDISLVLLKPSVKLNDAATKLYSKTWYEAQKDGTPLRDAVTNLAKESGDWSAEKEDRVKWLIDQLQGGEQTLKRGGIRLWGVPESSSNMPDTRMGGTGQAVAFQMVKDRAELSNLNSIMNKYYEHTAEAYADQAQFNFLLTNCTVVKGERRDDFYFVDAFGKPNVNIYHEKLADEDKATFDVVVAFQKQYYGDVVELRKKLPEWKFLADHKMIDADLNLVDKDGNLINIDGRRVDSEGYYLDAAGNRVDPSGRPLDKDGNYLVESQPFLDEEGVPLV